MRIPVALAWLLIAMALFTAGLLRQFHDLTPTSPFLAPAVGSLLFACVLFLFLVALRERQIGGIPGPGVRLGSLTPLLLLLLFEKWFSSSFYPPLFVLLAPPGLGDDAADAWFRALCGAGLCLVIAVASRFSKPAWSWTRARLAPAKAAAGVGAAVGAVGVVGLLLAMLSLAAGSRPSLLPPHARGPLAVVLAGQALLALAEEVYYRGLLLGEVLRLTPRLGISGRTARRWTALAMSSALFGMEHFAFTGGAEQAARQLVFALALGTLFGMIVFLTDNLWFAAALHAWINWLLLGAAPRLAFGPARAGIPPGASVSLALIAAFIAAYLMQRRIASARS